MCERREHETRSVEEPEQTPKRKRWIKPVVMVVELGKTETTSFVSPVEHHGSGTTVIGPLS